MSMGEEAVQDAMIESALRDSREERRRTFPRQSGTTQRSSAQLQIDFLRGAVNNAISIMEAGGYKNDPFKRQATQDLIDWGTQTLQMWGDPDIKGPMDFGREFVNTRAAQLQQQQRRRA